MTQTDSTNITHRTLRAAMQSIKVEQSLRVCTIIQTISVCKCVSARCMYLTICRRHTAVLLRASCGDANTPESCPHMHVDPRLSTSFLSLENLRPKRRDITRWCLLRHSPSYSSSPRVLCFSARRDLVFLFLSVRSRFYCAIFCHFGPRKGGRNAISPPLRPLL